MPDWRSATTSSSTPVWVRSTELQRKEERIKSSGAVDVGPAAASSSDQGAGKEIERKEDKETTGSEGSRGTRGKKSGRCIIA